MIQRNVIATVALVLAIASLALSQVPASGAIRGRVERSDSAQPLAGVTIILKPVATSEQTTAFLAAMQGRGRYPRELLSLAHDGLTVLLEERSLFPGSAWSDPIATDTSGAFRIEGVPAGRYAVIASKDGYFGRGDDPETPSIYDGAATRDMVYVTVEEDKVATVGMMLMPANAISGQVTGPDGMPLVGLDVRALRLHKEPSGTVLRGVTRTSTDDRGRYRLHTLPSGEYYIGAGLGDPELSGDSDPTDAVAQKLLFSFHPSTTDPSTAPAIVLGGGQELDDRNIVVRSAPLIRIVGEIVNSPDSDGTAPAYVSLAQRTWDIDFGGVLGGNHVLGSAQTVAAGPNRWKFEMRGAFPPGVHELRVASRRDTLSGGHTYSGIASVTVASGDIDGVLILLKK